MFRLRIIILIFCLIFTSGCWNQMDINDTAVCSGLGADIADDGKILFVAQLNKPVNQQEGGAKEAEFVVATGSGDTVGEAARKIMLTLPRLPLWSHADVLTLGENLARENLSIVLDFLYRNRNVRMSSNIFVARNTSLADLYSAECPLSLCSARGILKILRTQEKTLGVYIPVTLNEFIAKCATPGYDPSAPMITVTKDLEGKEVLTIDGTAVFKDKKMVGILDVTESRGLYWLYSKEPGGVLTIDYPEGSKEKVNLEISQFKSKIRPHLNEGQLSILINTEVAFNLLDLVGDINCSGPYFIQRIEEAASEEVAKQIKATISKGQLVGSDFLGFGRTIYRYEPDYWDKIEGDWANIYPHLDTDVKVKAKLLRTNLIISEDYKVK